MEIFNRAIHAGWNLRRIREMESAMMREGILDPLLDESETKTLDRMLRYYSLYDRIYNRSIRELRILQTNRALRYLMPREAAAQIPALVSPDDLTKRTQAARQALAHAIEDVLTTPAPRPSAVQNEPTAGPVLVGEVG
jgi:hypothetical protein